MKDIVILGAGGLAREVAWLLEENNSISLEWNIMGFISEEKGMNLRYPILGNDEWLKNYHREINAVCCIGNNSLRKKIISKYAGCSHIRFPNIISKKATLSDEIILGQGIIICAYTFVSLNVNIGDFTVINLRCGIGHDVKINEYVTINPGANISGNVTIGAESTIGVGACIIQGLSIGPDTTVGAGSSVLSDIKGHCTVLGVPARPIIKHDI